MKPGKISTKVSDPRTNVLAAFICICIMFYLFVYLSILKVFKVAIFEILTESWTIIEPVSDCTRPSHPVRFLSWEYPPWRTRTRTHTQSNVQISTAVPIITRLSHFSRANSTITTPLTPVDAAQSVHWAAHWTTCLGVKLSWRLTSQNRSPDKFCGHVDVKHAGNKGEKTVLWLASYTNSGMCRLLKWNIVDW